MILTEGCNMKYVFLALLLIGCAQSDGPASSQPDQSTPDIITFPDNDGFGYPMGTIDIDDGIYILDQNSNATTGDILTITGKSYERHSWYNSDYIVERGNLIYSGGYVTLQISEITPLACGYVMEHFTYPYGYKAQNGEMTEIKIGKNHGVKDDSFQFNKNYIETNLNHNCI